jgi:hypothetical protein
MAQARYHRSRRALGAIRLLAPSAPAPSGVVNVNNPYE